MIITDDLTFVNIFFTYVKARFLIRSIARPRPDIIPYRQKMRYRFCDDYDIIDDTVLAKMYREKAYLTLCKRIGIKFNFTIDRNGESDIIVKGNVFDCKFLKTSGDVDGTSNSFSQL